MKKNNNLKTLTSARLTIEFDGPPSSCCIPGGFYFLDKDNKTIGFDFELICDCSDKEELTKNCMSVELRRPDTTVFPRMKQITPDTIKNAIFTDLYISLDDNSPTPIRIIDAEFRFDADNTFIKASPKQLDQLSKGICTES